MQSVNKYNPAQFIKVLLHCAIFLATCVTTVLRNTTQAETVQAGFYHNCKLYLT